jgi:hypothetical protein
MVFHVRKEYRLQDLQAPRQLGIVTDAVFLDSLFPLTDSVQTFVYRVKARDKAVWVEWRMAESNRLLGWSAWNHLSGQDDMNLGVAAGRNEVKVEITGQAGRLTRLKRTLVGIP